MMMMMMMMMMIVMIIDYVINAELQVHLYCKK